MKPSKYSDPHIDKEPNLCMKVLQVADGLEPKASF